MKAARSRRRNARKGASGTRAAAAKPARAAAKAKAAPKRPVRRTAAQVRAAHQRALAGPPGTTLADWDACVAIALGASLRLAGGRVTDDDVLALHWAAGGRRDAGVSIEAALRAASVHGLAGVRLLSFKEVMPSGSAMGYNDCGSALRHRVTGAGLILGLDLPGPHAVTLAGDGSWLSWGGHVDPPDWPGAVLEEAWLVSWELASRR